MISSTDKNFGLFISIVLPGFVALTGIAYQSETVATWLGQAASDAPSVGGFLFLTVASIFAGLIISTIRWASIDSFHHYTGIAQPKWSFKKLAQRQFALLVLIDIHYRYYQFYANSLIALPFFVVLRWSVHDFSWLEAIGLICIESLFFAGSRDALRKYYRRGEQLLYTS